MERDRERKTRTFRERRGGADKEGEGGTEGVKELRREEKRQTDGQTERGKEGWKERETQQSHGSIIPCACPQAPPLHGIDLLRSEACPKPRP